MLNSAENGIILLINVKMPTIVGILTFMNMINTASESFQTRKILFNLLPFMSNWNFVLSWFEHEKCLITSGPVLKKYLRGYRDDNLIGGSEDIVQDIGNPYFCCSSDYYQHSGVHGTYHCHQRLPSSANWPIKRQESNQQDAYWTWRMNE